MQIELSPKRIAETNASGLWPNRILTDSFDEDVARHPDKIAITGSNAQSGEQTTLSYRQLRRIVDRMAIGLMKLGICPGDAVSVQLPNWWQFAALYLACVRIGAVINPLMPIFRQRELSYMLNFAESKVLVIPKRFRNFDYPSMANDLRQAAPKLEHILVVGDTIPDSFENALLVPLWETDAQDHARMTGVRPGPNDATQLLYTSGTTGEPKGVMHTSNTLISILQQYARRMRLGGDDVILMASPLAHQAGFMYGAMMGPLLGAKLVLQDVWIPDQAARLIQDEGVTYTKGSTPFLADLTDCPTLERYDINSLRVFVSSGAPIPRVLVQRATERLNCTIISAWGMSETGSVTTTRPEDPAEKIFGTDGIALPGMDVRVVNDQNDPLPRGTEGRLQCRGIGNFVGYFKRAGLANFSPEGWFDTGDMATMDDEGYIRITGRSKDIIIRGGENIPVVEIEELLYRHPAVATAAIVGMPDERLGERGCLFVTLKPDSVLSFSDMAAYLDKNRVAKQYQPERLEIISDMPRTASGKIQKFILREMAKKLKPQTG